MFQLLDSSRIGGRAVAPPFPLRPGYFPPVSTGGTNSVLWLPMADLGNGEVSIKLGRGTGSATFTRATAASCRLADGLLKKVATGVPRSHYLSSGAYAGYLAETARTNICLQSEDLATTWTNTRSSESANATTAPDGTATADKLVEDATAGNTHLIQQAITFTNVVHTFSVFLKAGERTWARIRINDGTTTFSGFFNLSTGVAGTLANATAAVEAWTNGWYRCSITTNAATAAAAGNVFIDLAEADTDVTFDGDGASGLYVWGAQVEAGAFVSSYIPTTTASVTRNEDLLTIPTDSNVSDTAGTVYAEVSTTFTTAPATADLVAFANTTAGSMHIASAGASTTIRGNDGTTSVTKSGLTDAATAVRKRAISWGATGMSATGDGAAVATAVFDGGFGVAATMGIGNDGNGGTALNGTLKNIHVWLTQLADGDLVALTA